MLQAKIFASTRRIIPQRSHGDLIVCETRDDATIERRRNSPKLPYFIVNKQKEKRKNGERVRFLISVACYRTGKRNLSKRCCFEARLTATEMVRWLHQCHEMHRKEVVHTLTRLNVRTYVQTRVYTYVATVVELSYSFSRKVNDRLLCETPRQRVACKYERLLKVRLYRTPA